MLTVKVAGHRCSIHIQQREWNNCFIKNNQDILLGLTNFIVQGRPEDNLMATVSRYCIMADIPRPLGQSKPWNYIIQLQLNLSTTATLGTVESGRCGEVAVMER